MKNKQEMSQLQILDMDRVLNFYTFILQIESNIKASIQRNLITSKIDNQFKTYKISKSIIFVLFPSKIKNSRFQRKTSYMPSVIYG